MRPNTSLSKKIVTVLLIFSFLITIVAPILPVFIEPVRAVEFSGGNGSASNPYIITTAEQLDNLRNCYGSISQNKYWKLGNDIDLTDYIAEKYPEKGWEPIGGRSEDGLLSGYVFEGDLDGAGYCISGLWINRPDEDYVGLFGGLAYNEVKNLGIIIDESKGGVVGNQNVGGLVGESSSTDFTGCYTTGKIDGFKNVGGLAGSTVRGTISMCYSTAEVIAANSAGGLIGYQAAGTVTDCYTTGDLYYKQGYVMNHSFGGIAGFVAPTLNDDAPIIKNCYTTSNLYGHVSATYFGGIVGQMRWSGSISNCIVLSQVINSTPDTHRVFAKIMMPDSNGVKLKNNYANRYMKIVDPRYNTEISISDKGKDKYDGEDINIADAKKLSTYTNLNLNWDFDRIWYVDEGNSYPVFRYQVLGFGGGTSDNPFLIRTPQQLDNLRGFTNVLFKNVYWKLACDIDLTTYIASNSEGWNPIGISNMFYGHLDGDGHVIKGLWINRPNTEYVGLFGRLASDSEVKNLGIIIAEGKQVVGKNYVGGLAGVQYGNITNNFCIGAVRGNVFTGGSEFAGNKIGGLVGYQAGGSTTNCFTVGEVIGYEDIGGLTGHVANGTISKSYSNSHVTALALGGGLVGYNNKGNIENCYALGNIDTLGGCAGGLVGTQELGGIQNSFASVIINEFTPTAGGLVGRLVGGSIQLSFFDSTIMSGKNTVADYVDGVIIYSSGKSTEEMMQRNSYTSWIFNADNWGMYADGNGYPYLASIHNYTLVTPTGGGSKVYDGVEVTPSLSYTCSDYYNESRPLTGNISFPAIKNPGVSKAGIGTLNGPYYQLRFNNSITYTVTKANPTLTISASPSSPRVSGTTIYLVVNLRGVTGGESPKGTLQIKNGTDTIATYTVNGNFNVSLIWSSYQYIGENNIIAVYSGDSNYNAVISEVLPYHIIGKSTINLPNQTVEYSGSPVDLTGKGMATGSTGAITYQFYSDYECTQPIPAPVNVGTYYCIATVAPDEDYASASDFATVIITPKALSETDITVSDIDTVQYFTGNPVTPIPTIVTDTGATLINGIDYDLSYSNNVAVGTATVAVTFKGNYSGTVSRTFGIVYAPADSSLYTISGGIDGWTNQDIVITGVGDNTLCLTPTGTYSNTLTITEESVSESGTSFTFYVKDSDGIIHENVIVYKLDKTAPTGEIKLDTNVWKSFLNTITFDVFFKEIKTVYITADSDLSGTTIKYYKSETPIADTEIAGISDWVSGTSFDISPNEKCFIYAKITDGAGNVTYLNSDGIVFYTDSEQDTKSIGFTKTSKSDVTADVKLNGNTIKEITYNGAALTQGVDYTVNGGTITFAAGYLDTFAASETPYTFIINYNPLDETYVDSSGNQAPATTGIELTVSKAEVTPVVVVVPSEQTRPNKVTLSVSELENTTGTVRFFANGSEIATVPVGSTVEFTAQGSVDTYTFTAVYSGDDNYNSATSAETIFTFTKGSQSALAITPVEAKTYGDPDFTLSTTGGSGSGAVTYTVTNGSDVISISGNTVSILKAGTATIVATKAGDDDYNPVTSEPITITVEKAAQAGVSISTFTDKIIYGDSFTFAATGGSGTGAYVWTITNEKDTSNASVPAGTVATIDPSTGVVTTKAAGSFTVNVVRSGDENYNESLTASKDVTVVEKNEETPDENSKTPDENSETSGNNNSETSDNNNSETSDNNTEIPITGDRTQPALPIILMVACVFVISLTLRKRRGVITE